MESVSVCYTCGRTISKDYPFCPWCGESCYGKSLLCTAAKHDEQNSLPTGEKLHKLENSLAQLEKDLSELILEYDKVIK